jgi:hypothetical protein
MRLIESNNKIHGVKPEGKSLCGHVRFVKNSETFEDTSKKVSCKLCNWIIDNRSVKESAV